MTLKELFNDPARWTQGAMARDSEGKPVEFNSDDGASWCLTGGLLYCDMYNFRANRDTIMMLLHASTLIDWNDDRGRKFTEIRSLVKNLPF